MRSIVNDSGRTLDHAIDALYDPINALQRQVLDIERSYRDLAQRDDLATDTLGAPTIPAEAIAGITEALASLRDALRAAEGRRDTAKQHAARLYIDH